MAPWVETEFASIDEAFKIAKALDMRPVWQDHPGYRCFKCWNDRQPSLVAQAEAGGPVKQMLLKKLSRRGRRRKVRDYVRADVSNLDPETLPKTAGPWCSTEYVSFDEVLEHYERNFPTGAPVGQLYQALAIKVQHDVYEYRLFNGYIEARVVYPSVRKDPSMLRDD